jgi:hypothetical protein
MHSLVIRGFLGLVTLGADGNLPTDQKGSAWLKDYTQAKAKAVRENKPIFAVFR